MESRSLAWPVRPRLAAGTRAGGRERRPAAATKAGTRPALVRRACLLVRLPAPGGAEELQTQTLDAGWQLRLAPGDAYAPAHPQASRRLLATVPGSVHTDVIAAGLPGDPFVGTREAAIQWFGLSDRSYRTRFEVGPVTLASAPRRAGVRRAGHRRREAHVMNAGR